MFFPLSMMLVTGLTYITFIMLNSVPFIFAGVLSLLFGKGLSLSAFIEGIT